MSALRVPDYVMEFGAAVGLVILPLLLLVILGIGSGPVRFAASGSLASLGVVVVAIGILTRRGAETVDGSGSEPVTADRPSIIADRPASPPRSHTPPRGRATPKRSQRH